MNNSITHCKGTTASGEQCRRKPGSSGFCHVHDPELKRQAEAAEQSLFEEQNALIQLRQKQIELVRQEIKKLESKRLQAQERGRTHQLLLSVADGLYIEIEKLTKKAPAEQITELALEQINDVIADTRELLKNDSYIQKLKVFIPAGDLPQLRDALIVLRQIKQGLARFNEASDTSINNQIKKLMNVETALKLVLDEGDHAMLKKLESNGDIFNGIALSNEWGNQEPEIDRELLKTLF